MPKRLKKKVTLQAVEKRKPSVQEQTKAHRKELISKIHAGSHEIYGAPKIRQELLKRGVRIARRTVSTYMGELGICAYYRKKTKRYKPHLVLRKDLTDILKRQFNPEQPNTIWSTDITYIWTKTGFVYLTSIMDLYSRKIVA